MDEARKLVGRVHTSRGKRASLDTFYISLAIQPAVAWFDSAEAERTTTPTLPPAP